MTVPLLDLKAQYATIRSEILDAVIEVLDSQVCIGGPKVAELEQKVAALSGCKYGVGVSSGTDALLCSMMALGLGAGDEVITTPFTFFATAGSIVRTGASPVFVDIDPRTYNIDAKLIADAITPRTRAIIPVHLFGQMCEMDPIMEIAKRFGLFVIEDAAQSITATYKGQKAGSVGTVGCFSFFPSKNLGAAGDAGMIVTNDERVYDRLIVLRNHGAKPKYFHKYTGGNFRLDALQAAILLAKLPFFDLWCAARRAHAEYYNQLFRESSVVCPYISGDCMSVYNQYVIRLPKGRDDLIAWLKGRQIGCEVYYPLPLHLQECFRHLGCTEGRFPVSERASKEVLAIPVYPELTKPMQEYVADATLAFLASRAARTRIEVMAV